MFTRAPLHRFVFALTLLINSVFVSANNLKSCILERYSQPTIATLGLPDPSTAGNYKFQIFEYGKKTSLLSFSKPDIVTPTANLPDFLAEYSRKEDYKHDAYHQFNSNKLPLNAKVWLPNGNGPFPLVLITHGNSAPGFNYLGELLASRGYVVAQVDQTYLNDLWGENGARGWIVLEHLKLWRQWSSEPESPFYQKVDIENVALIGMSRGGEAVALAARFNQFKTLPNSTEPLNLGFNIRAVIALAPMDGQYMHADGGNVLKNTNYLVLQGGHDADVYQFLGSRQWQRTYFDDGQDYIKQLIYVYRSNHINFNQSMSGSFHWGQRGDFDSQLLTPAQQEKLTKVFVSGFLEASLLNKLEYRQLFKQPTLAEFGLPKDIYISRYKTSDFNVIEDFESKPEKINIMQVYPEKNPISLPITTKTERLRNGTETPNHVLKLLLTRDIETRVRIQLPSSVLPKMGGNRNFNLQFSLARADSAELDKCKSYNLFSDAKVELSRDSLLLFSKTLSDIGVVSPLLLSDFSELERGEIRYAPTEPVLQTFTVPIKLAELADNSIKNDSLIELVIIFKPSQDVTIILDDIGTINGSL